MDTKESADRKPSFDSEGNGLTRADAMTVDFTAADGALSEPVLSKFGYVC